MIGTVLLWVSTTLALSIYEGEKHWRYLQYPATTIVTSAILTLPLAALFFVLVKWR